MGEALYLLNCLICYLSSDITMLMGLCEFCEFFYALFLYLVTSPILWFVWAALAAKQEKFVYLDKVALVCVILVLASCPSSLLKTKSQ